MGFTFNNNAVCRYAAARFCNNNITNHNIFCGNFFQIAVSFNKCCFWHKVNQLVQRFACFALAFCFQIFAQIDKCKYHGGRLKIKVHMVLVHCCHITDAQGVAHAIDGEYAVDKPCGGTDGNKAVHIRTAVPQRGKTFAEISVVNHQHRYAQQKLGKCKGNGIFCAFKEKRQWRTKHTAHRYIHQRYKKTKADSNTFFESLKFLTVVTQPLWWGGGFAVCGFCGGNTGVVTCLDNSFYYLAAAKDVFVKVYLHTVGKQVYNHLADTIKF